MYGLGESRKVIALDMDDTLCHLVKTAVARHNERYPGHGLSIEGITDFDISKFWHPNCTDEEFFGVPGMFRELEVFDEFVIEEVKALAERYDVIIITASSPQFVVDKWAWVQKHLPFIPYENFYVARRKEKIDFDLLIDDGAHNLLAAKERGRGVIGISRPWNQQLADEVLLVDSWEGMRCRVESFFAVKSLSGG